MARQQEATLLLKIKTQGEKAFKSIRSSINNIGEAALKIGGALGVVGVAIGKLARDASKFNEVKSSFNSLATSQGQDAKEMLKNMRELSKGTVSDLDLMKNANKALLLGLPVEKFGDMLQIARSSSKATGESMEFMLNSIVTGLGRGSKLILDNLGIVIDTNKAYEKHAKTLNKTADALTDYEKKQAFINEAMSIGKANAKVLGSANVSLEDKYQQLIATVQNLLITIGKELIPVVEVAIDTFKSISKSVTDLANNETLSKWLEATVLGFVRTKQIIASTWNSIKSLWGDGNKEMNLNSKQNMKELEAIHKRFERSRVKNALANNADVATLMKKHNSEMVKEEIDIKKKAAKLLAKITKAKKDREVKDAKEAAKDISDIEKGALIDKLALEKVKTSETTKAEYERHRAIVAQRKGTIEEIKALNEIELMLEEEKNRINQEVNDNKFQNFLDNNRETFEAAKILTQNLAQLEEFSGMERLAKTKENAAKIIEAEKQKYDSIVQKRKDAQAELKRLQQKGNEEDLADAKDRLERLRKNRDFEIRETEIAEKSLRDRIAKAREEGNTEELKELNLQLEKLLFRKQTSKTDFEKEEKDLQKKVTDAKTVGTQDQIKAQKEKIAGLIEEENKAKDDFVKVEKEQNDLVAAEKKRSSKELFLIAKAASIANIVVSGIEAAVKALAQLGPIAGGVAAAGIGLGTAAAVAKVTNETIDFAEGGIIPATEGGIIGRVGEAGRDEAIIPLEDGAPASGLGGTTVVINVNGGLMGDEDSARELAVALDRELLKLKQNNEASSLEGVI